MLTQGIGGDQGELQLVAKRAFKRELEEAVCAFNRIENASAGRLPSHSSREQKHHRSQDRIATLDD